MHKPQMLPVVWQSCDKELCALEEESVLSCKLAIKEGESTIFNLTNICTYLISLFLVSI